MIDGRTNNVGTIGLGLAAVDSPDGLAVDELRNKIYVAEWATRVAIIDGASNTVTEVENPGGNTHRLTADPLADEFYTLNMTDNIYNKRPLSSITVFAGP